MTEPHDFPPPWRVVELEAAYRVEDAIGFTVAYICFTEDPEQLGFTGRLSKDEAWYVALQVARAPDIHIASMTLEQEQIKPRSTAARKGR
ncbi:hypothetical protein [Methylobacterium oxalidis]|uniref:Uncharacterized protein n=1 Tax=Methylobacterium oxalidis TaxID=944322 RepID=A0A512J9G1_9HYPH|nr:hypothetical protein [Methylobacterium oxalidis]GEP06499.1 hypothetical protein MOX02_45370 [Methylobacterium oxalidis]GJE30698.1 hypothetical protein LDDCCGHA_0867 [Methylobacterium oxalidis]GLS63923.1 hypothetical protein GCM10007888_23040 [Methylobacterium oxalidis]